MTLQSREAIRPLTLSQVLVAPFRAVIYGHIFLILYTITAFCVLFLFLREVQRALHALIVALELHKNFASTNALETAIVMGLWLVVLPATIATVAMPIRAIWLNHRIRFVELLQWTLPALRKSAFSLLVSGKALLVVVVPMAAMLMLHRVLRENNMLAHLEMLFYVLALVVLAFVSVRGCGVLFSVLISVCTGVHPEVGLAISQQMLRHKFMHMLVIILISVSVVALTHFGMRYFGFRPRQVAAVEIYCGMFMLWYALSSLCVLALETSEEYVRRSGRTFRPELMAHPNPRYESEQSSSYGA